MKRFAKTISLTAILVIFGLSFALNSCKKDGLDKTAKMFVGTWVQSDNKTWEFKSDGTCTYTVTYSYYPTDSYTGTWKYLPEKKILVPDILDWTWEILDITDTQWVGEGGSGKRYVYTRKK